VFPSGAERILMVDDEVAILKAVSGTLEKLGYTVTTCAGSKEALSLFRLAPQSFDLVITDMTMPVMTGDRLAEALMEIRPDIPIILCTGYSGKMDDEQAADIGIKAFAYKPLIKRDLALTVRRVLEENRAVMRVLRAAFPKEEG
jgi:CheY-like chemotaxis protein